MTTIIGLNAIPFHCAVKGGSKQEMEEEKEDYSPTSLVSGFSSALSDEGTSLTSTVASAFSTTISGVAFFIGEGDFERGPGIVSSGQETGGDTSTGDREITCVVASVWDVTHLAR